MNEILQLLQFLQANDQGSIVAKQEDLVKLASIIQQQDQQIQSLVAQYDSSLRAAAASELLTSISIFVLVVFVVIFGVVLSRLEKRVKNLTKQLDGDMSVVSLKTADGGDTIMELTLDQMRNLVKFGGRVVNLVDTKDGAKMVFSNV